MIFDNRIRKNLNIYTAGGVREGTTIERFGGVQENLLAATILLEKKCRVATPGIV